MNTKKKKNEKGIQNKYIKINEYNKYNILHILKKQISKR